MQAGTQDTDVLSYGTFFEDSMQGFTSQRRKNIMGKVQALELLQSSGTLSRGMLDKEGKKLPAIQGILTTPWSKRRHIGSKGAKIPSTTEGLMLPLSASNFKGVMLKKIGCSAPNARQCNRNVELANAGCSRKRRMGGQVALGDQGTHMIGGDMIEKQVSNPENADEHLQKGGWTLN
eukprot:1146464-Pelagomonas_calceolata.AAC.1